MNYQHSPKNEAPVNLEALDDKLIAIMERIPKILETRQAERTRKFMADTRKAAKEKGFRVSFEKISTAKRRKRLSHSES